MMKNTALYILLLLSPVVLVAQSAKDVKFAWTDATDLTMLGQFFSENPNPFHRVDTTRFKGFTAGENRQVRCGVGMICAFRTNSTIISVDPEYGDVGFPTNTMGISARGFDLYIRKDGQWINAASTVSGDKSLNNPVTLINNMDGEEKECLIYLPIQSELRELKIGVQEGKTLLPLENPFRHRIAFFGSSFTHGSSTSRPAMNYPSQLSRATGLHVLNLGCAGNCKLQPYFCDVLCATDADAFVFDAFSNPSVEQIEERLFPFIEKLQKAHPGK
ncbi:MAG: SGNH/GDSL hydrolase family protein, partial [Bacteroidaceae bacterium]|nr:SGNH/GDSL hydrolase family protein [Bacteroidaceae bacterium]